MDFDKVKGWIFEIIDIGFKIGLWLIGMLIGIILGIGLLISYIICIYSGITSDNLIANIIGWIFAIVIGLFLSGLIISGIYKLITIEIDDGECEYCHGSGLAPEDSWVDDSIGHGPVPSSCFSCLGSGRKKKRILKWRNRDQRK